MIIIGSRGSALALAQTGWVRDQISARFPEEQITIKIIKTSADKNPTASIRASSSVGVFVKELEQELLKRDIDIAVHSMKDVPTLLAEGLVISAVPEREDARDAFISDKAPRLIDLPPNSIVGTGSIRRQSQALALRPDLKVADIRGNVDTRLKKLHDGAYDAIILACAGLNRLGLQKEIRSPFEFGDMLPAPGQGALAIEVRSDDPKAVKLTSALSHVPTAKAVSAERLFLQHMGGGCNVPVAAFARFSGNVMQMEGLVASPDGKTVIAESIQQRSEMANEAVRMLADRILARGGREILDSL
jgi:hydroxymethylbilane synthase